MFKKKEKKDKVKQTNLKDTPSTGTPTESPEDSADESIVLHSGNDLDGETLFFENRKSVKELVSPVLVNPNPLEYFVITDSETNVFTLSYYVDKVPNNVKLASTFAPLFNYPNTTSSVFISKLGEGRASKILDARVQQIEIELISAKKAVDTNRIRKLEQKYDDANRWARAIEIGDNSLYEVGFLFLLQDTDLAKLINRAKEMHSRAKERGVELVACSSAHPEAFLSSYPTNRIFVPAIGPLKGMTVKKHVFDKYALTTLFNHTRNEFSHKNGIPIGHNMSTGQLIKYDPYDPSHDGYGVIFVGKTGTGKSASVKIFTTRFLDFGYKIRSIDFERKGGRGEYSPACDAVGGVNYSIHSKSNNILNLFEVNIEYTYDEATDREYPELKLADMLSNLRNVQMTLLKDGMSNINFELFIYVKSILDSINLELFSERGIYDGDVDSLFTDNLSESSITSGKVKKTLPTVTEFYKKILLYAALNKNKLHEEPYQILIDGFRERVRELYYCMIPGVDVIFFTKKEYQELPKNSKGMHVFKYENKEYLATCVLGTKAYFDGQSTVLAGPETPWINIDISGLPKEDRDSALLVAQNYMGENCVKGNSENPKKASKMILLIDELHKTFHIEEARKFIEEAYRTYRKRNVSPWAITQFLSDFERYPETEGLLKNATSIFMLKQEAIDKEFLKRMTPLTDSQLAKLFTLGHGDAVGDNNHKGELCLIDNNHVCFLKVDYLVKSEALVVETDINKIKQMYAGSYGAAS